MSKKANKKRKHYKLERDYCRDGFIVNFHGKLIGFVRRKVRIKEQKALY